jgi:hypothetical protein
VQKGVKAWKGGRRKKGWRPEKVASMASIFSFVLKLISFIVAPLLLLIHLNLGPFYGFHVLFVKFLIFSTLCSNNSLAALAVQCKNKTTAAQPVSRIRFFGFLDSYPLAFLLTRSTYCNYFTAKKKHQPYRFPYKQSSLMANAMDLEPKLC